MAKFKIYFAVKSSFEFEVDAKDKDEAREKMHEVSMAIEEAITAGAKAEGLTVSDIWGGDDDEITDLEMPEADRASISGVFTMQLTCPHCNAKMFIDDSEGRYGDITGGIDNEGFAIVTCDECEKQFKQTSYKEY